MLTKDQSRYLKKISAYKKVKIYPYNKKLGGTAKKIMAKIRSQFPSLKIMHMGASALGITGQADLDIYALSPKAKFQKYLPAMQKMFGKPLSQHSASIEWKFQEDGIDVELYLTDPKSPTMQRQMKIFKILKNNPHLLKEYENLKQTMNGKSFRKYQRRKYEFYNRILKSNYGKNLRTKEDF